jgi:hypothetical protein
MGFPNPRHCEELSGRNDDAQAGQADLRGEEESPAHAIGFRDCFAEISSGLPKARAMGSQ